MFEEEEQEDDGEYRLEISNDYYAMAFCTTLDIAREQCPNLSEYGYLKYFYNVMFVVIMQVSLLFFVSLELWYEPVYASHFYILVPRFMCAVLLHMTVEPEVRQAIQMYKYFIDHNKVISQE